MHRVVTDGVTTNGVTTNEVATNGVATNGVTTNRVTTNGDATFTERVQRLKMNITNTGPQSGRYGTLLSPS